MTAQSTLGKEIADLVQDYQRLCDRVRSHRLYPLVEQKTVIDAEKDFTEFNILVEKARGLSTQLSRKLGIEIPSPVCEDDYLLCVPGLAPHHRPLSSPHLDGNVVLMDITTTYALGVQALRDSYARGECPTQPLFTESDGSTLVRPLTFKENIDARVNDYESNKGKAERLRLFARWLNSSTAIAYKKSTGKFKIIPISSELVTIPQDFNEASISVGYDGLVGTELDRSAAKYNEPLTKDEVLAHPAWQAAVEGDVALLRAYRDIVFAEKRGVDKLMSFWLLGNPDRDKLRALYVFDLSNGSNAVGSCDLNINGSFLRGSPSSSSQKKEVR